MLLAERRLPVLLAEITTTPDASADPDAGDANDENDQHDDPLPVAGEPRDSGKSIMSKTGGIIVMATYQSPPPLLLPLLEPDDPAVFAALADVLVAVLGVFAAPACTLQACENQRAMELTP